MAAAGVGGVASQGSPDPALLAELEAESARAADLTASVAAADSKIAAHVTHAARMKETYVQLTGMYDKGKAAVVETTTTAVMNGEPLYSLLSTAFIKGEGGWGGDRGPSGPKNVAPESDPDHVVTYTTSRDQAFVYRLSGDRNPLHTDPAFAAMGGFDTPILHGLCTYGFTGRALLSALCDNDPARFSSMEGRFSSPVLPGEALTINIWKTGDGQAVFQTAGGDGRIVLNNGGVTHT